MHVGAIQPAPTTPHGAPWCLAQSSIWLTPAQMLSVGLMIGGMLVLVWAFRGRTPPPPPPPTGRDTPDPDPRAVVRDAEELLQLLAEQADAHAGRLERLIVEADQRIRRLEHLAAGAAAARARTEQVDPLNSQVYLLADEGVPPVEIARQLEQQVGKVELILALRRR